MSGTIKFQGREWRLHKETSAKLVFVPANNPLLDWRKKNKLNQRAASERLGVSQGYLSKMESGEMPYTPAILSGISK